MPEKPQAQAQRDLKRQDLLAMSNSLVAPGKTYALVYRVHGDWLLAKGGLLGVDRSATKLAEHLKSSKSFIVLDRKMAGNVGSGTPFSNGTALAVGIKIANKPEARTVSAITTPFASYNPPGPAKFSLRLMTPWTPGSTGAEAGQDLVTTAATASTMREFSNDPLRSVKDALDTAAEGGKTALKLTGFLVVAVIIGLIAWGAMTLRRAGGGP